MEPQTCSNQSDSETQSKRSFSTVNSSKNIPEIPQHFENILKELAAMNQVLFDLSNQISSLEKDRFIVPIQY